MTILPRHAAQAKPSSTMANQRMRGKRHAGINAQAATAPISQRDGNDGSHCTAEMPINNASADGTTPGYVLTCFTINATLAQAHKRACKGLAQRADRMTRTLNLPQVELRRNWTPRWEISMAMLGFAPDKARGSAQPTGD